MCSWRSFRYDVWIIIGVLMGGVAPHERLWAADAAGPPLPIRRVVLLTSGVGFFEHAGTIEGDQTLEMRFEVREVNDLLKSMVLQDLGGGQIAAVTYGSQDPVSRALKSFSIDLTDSPSMAELLQQIRGQKIQVSLPTPLVGVIIGVERRPVPAANGEWLETDHIHLKTETGLRSVPIENISEIRLLNEKLDEEFQQALELLASAHTADKRTVGLHFRGEGKRQVKVGYIREFPIWKTTYRLILSDEKPPLLQGWAIVENTTDHDWNAVQLTLVSGRPISFVMDLYQPLYVERPVVMPDLFAGLRPSAHGADLGGEDVSNAFGGASKFGRERLAGGGLGGGGGEAMPKRESARARADSDIVNGRELQEFVATTAPAMATAGEVGELFRYSIDTPVDLRRQKSAMLPIVSAEVKAEKVSIYNPAIQVKHPLSGLKLTNSTDLHLMQGPVTVFDGGEYAGDARIADVAPHEQRLVSYALDLDTEVVPQSEATDGEIVSMKITKGLLHRTDKRRRTHRYVVKNSGSRAKRVLLEQPIDASWTLVEPAKPSEKTRGLYRFAVDVPPSETAHFEVREEQVVEEELAVLTLSDDVIAVYVRAKKVDPDVKAALTEVFARKDAVAKIAQQLDAVATQVRTIGEDQARIRENMARLDRNSELYLRYIKKLTEQESEIEELQERIEQLTAERNAKDRQLAEYLLTLDVG